MTQSDARVSSSVKRSKQMVDVRPAGRDWLVFDPGGLGEAVTPDRGDSMTVARTRSRRWRIYPEAADVAAGRREQTSDRCWRSSAEGRSRLMFVLEELQALVVQVEPRISCEVELLEFRRKRLGQSDLGQLVAAQIDALTAGQLELRVTHSSWE